MPKVTLNDKAARRPAPETGQIELWDTVLPGFGLRIAAGGARTYFAVRRLNGKLTRRTIGKHPPMHLTKGDQLGPDELWPSAARTRARKVLEEMAGGVDSIGRLKGGKSAPEPVDVAPPPVADTLLSVGTPRPGLRAVWRPSDPRSGAIGHRE